MGCRAPKRVISLSERVRHLKNGLELQLHDFLSLGSDGSATAAMVPRPIYMDGWETDFHGIYPEQDRAPELVE